MSSSASKPNGQGKVDLDPRLTLRLPNDLLSWVRQQGGSGFVRDLLVQHRGLLTTGGPDLNAQWEHIVYERESIEDEWKLLRDQERLLDRARDRLADERRLLDERRELLEGESSYLEDSRMELQSREEILGEVWVRLSLAPAILLNIAGLALRQTVGRPLV